MLTVREATATVSGRQGTARQGFGRTARRDWWWIEPGLIVVGFSTFVVYSLFTAIVWTPVFGVPYEAEGYLSPFFSPLIRPDWLPTWFSPAILILWAPLGFRATCYYYRKAYYRSYFADPPGCAVGEPRVRYGGERGFPFVLQNLHRFFLYAATVPVVFLWLDVFLSLRHGDDWRLGLGTLVLGLNAALLSGYSLGCHSLRHLIGGSLDCFSCTRRTRARNRLWRAASWFNAHHMAWAWVSLVVVALADLYVRLVAMGALADPHVLL